MIFIPVLLIGIFIGWLLCRPGRNRLKFEKEMLLDFNEKLIKDKEDMEKHESHLALRLFHAEHPELEDKILDAEVIG